MAQHFLYSSAARTLSLLDVARMTDAEAFAAFKGVRFAENGGEPFCSWCGSLGVWEYESRKIFKCKGCLKQFSLTSGTIFDNRKMPLRDILAGIAIFVNAANGHAALHMTRELGVSYKTAFVLAHKLREVLGSLQPTEPLTGIVEIDGVWIGGHYKKANMKVDRRDMRKSNPKRRTVVTMRERRAGGRSRSFVYKSEKDAIPDIVRHVSPAAKIRTDDGNHWNILRAYFDNVRSVNHKIGYQINGIDTNWVESFNGRVRRAERGVHSRISGRYLKSYANELAWREDHRRRDNGWQWREVMGASARQRKSTDWRGYWQRHSKKESKHG